MDAAPLGRGVLTGASIEEPAARTDSATVSDLRRFDEAAPAVRRFITTRATLKVP